MLNETLKEYINGSITEQSKLDSMAEMFDGKINEYQQLIHTFSELSSTLSPDALEDQADQLDAWIEERSNITGDTTEEIEDLIQRGIEPYTAEFIMTGIGFDMEDHLASVGLEVTNMMLETSEGSIELYDLMFAFMNSAEDDTTIFVKTLEGQIISVDEAMEMVNANIHSAVVFSSAIKTAMVDDVSERITMMRDHMSRHVTNPYDDISGVMDRVMPILDANLTHVDRVKLLLTSAGIDPEKEDDTIEDAINSELSRYTGASPSFVLRFPGLEGIPGVVLTGVVAVVKGIKGLWRGMKRLVNKGTTYLKETLIDPNDLDFINKKGEGSIEGFARVFRNEVMILPEDFTFQDRSELANYMGDQTFSFKYDYTFATLLVNNLKYEFVPGGDFIIINEGDGSNRIKIAHTFNTDQDSLAAFYHLADRGVNAGELQYTTTVQSDIWGIPASLEVIINKNANDHFIVYMMLYDGDMEVLADYEFDGGDWESILNHSYQLESYALPMTSEGQIIDTVVGNDYMTYDMDVYLKPTVFNADTMSSLFTTYDENYYSSFFETVSFLEIENDHSSEVTMWKGFANSLLVMGMYSEMITWLQSSRNPINFDDFGSINYISEITKVGNIDFIRLASGYNPANGSFNSQSLAPFHPGGISGHGFVLFYINFLVDKMRGNPITMNPFIETKVVPPVASYRVKTDEENAKAFTKFILVSLIVVVVAVVAVKAIAVLKKSAVVTQLKYEGMRKELAGKALTGKVSAKDIKGLRKLRKQAKLTAALAGGLAYGKATSVDMLSPLESADQSGEILRTITGF